MMMLLLGTHFQPTSWTFTHAAFCRHLKTYLFRSPGWLTLIITIYYDIVIVRRYWALAERRHSKFWWRWWGWGWRRWWWWCWWWWWCFRRGRVLPANSKLSRWRRCVYQHSWWIQVSDGHVSSRFRQVAGGRKPQQVRDTTHALSVRPHTLCLLALCYADAPCTQQVFHTLCNWIRSGRREEDDEQKFQTHR